MLAIDQPMLRMRGPTAPVTPRQILSSDGGRIWKASL